MRTYIPDPTQRYNPPDARDAAPMCRCTCCSKEVHPGEYLFHWDKGETLCTNCFRDRVESLPDAILADQMGLSYTEVR